MRNRKVANVAQRQQTDGVVDRLRGRRSAALSDERRLSFQSRLFMPAVAFLVGAVPFFAALTGGPAVGAFGLGPSTGQQEPDGTETAVVGVGVTNQVLEIDVAASEVSFVLGATAHEVHGMFEITSGAVSFDPATRRAWGEINVDARSASTGSTGRDKTMHRKVLASEKYPLIVFHPATIEGTVALEGSSEFVLVGTVTLLGQQRELRLATSAKVENGKVEAKATFEVPYVEWGLHDPSVFLLRVAKVVSVELKVVGTLHDGRGASPAGTGSPLGGIRPF